MISRPLVSEAQMPLEVRVPARLLTIFYICASIANIVSMTHYTFFIDVQRSVLLDGLRVAFLLVTMANVALARRGRIELASGLFGAVLLGMSLYYTVDGGGLGAFVCMTTLPVVMLGILPKKRPIFIMSTIFYVAHLLAHLWVSLAPPGAFPEPVYEFKVALMSYTVMMIATVLVTILCSHINLVAHDDISKSTAEFDHARQLVKAHHEQLASARQKAELTKRAKSRFLANMSHELRTPLNAIIGYADLLEEDFEAASLEATYSEDIRRIRASGGHLLSIINDILDLSRIEAGKMPITNHTFTARSLVDGARALVAQRGEPHPPMSPPQWPEDSALRALAAATIEGDEMLLHRALAHMVLDAMLSGSVHVSLTELAPEALALHIDWRTRLEDEPQLRELHPQLSKPLYTSLCDLLGLTHDESDARRVLIIPLVKDAT